MEQKLRSNGEKVKKIITDAGGRIVGRTRLQKTAYLLEIAGEGEGFHFEYHHYGPYSEELSRAASIAQLVGEIAEEEKTADWGGSYSIYTTTDLPQENGVRQRLAQTATAANAVVLELAATAAYFALNNAQDPWQETVARKPDKAAGGRLGEARALYGKLREISEKLPPINPATN